MLIYLQFLNYYEPFGINPNHCLGLFMMCPCFNVICAWTRGKYLGYVMFVAQSIRHPGPCGRYPLSFLGDSAGAPLLWSDVLKLSKSKMK